MSCLSPRAYMVLKYRIKDISFVRNSRISKPYSELLHECKNAWVFIDYNAYLLINGKPPVYVTGIDNSNFGEYVSARYPGELNRLCGICRVVFEEALENPKELPF